MSDQNTTNVEQKVQNLNLNDDRIINILLLGETGTGKSTFINSIINYLQYEDFFKAKKNNLNVLIPSTFTIFDSNKKSNVVKVDSIAEDQNEVLELGKSGTQNVKTYTFRIKKGNIQIRLIDTPGMGDTSGIEQDDRNCENILNYISRLHELHAICYLCQPEQSRATVYFQYCVAQILSRLEKSACKNFVFVFTKTRMSNYKPGETFSLLQEIARKIRENASQAELPLDNNMFCFDNAAFRYLAAIKNSVQVDKSDEQSMVESWNHSSKECWRMIDYIITLKPHFVKHTAAINEARRVIYQLAQPMADIAQLISDNIRILENHRSNLDLDKKSLSELKQKLYVPIIDLEVTKLPDPVTVCTASKCSDLFVIDELKQWHYKTRCHDPCYLKNVQREIVGTPELMDCAAMESTQNCKKCGCSYKVHMHVYYRTRKFGSHKKDDSVLQSINTKELVIENVNRIIDETKVRSRKLESELQVIVECNAKFAHFLNKNAIAPFSDSYEEYINYMIIKEKALGPSCDLITLTGLEKLLHQHQEMKKFFKQAAITQEGQGETDPVTPMEINNTFQKLFSLELNGKKIKELYESQKKSIKKEHMNSFTEYKHQGTFAPGKAAASKPNTKFQQGTSKGKPNQRGNNTRGKSAGGGRQRNRTPPPSYDSSQRVQQRPPSQNYPTQSYNPVQNLPPPNNPQQPHQPPKHKVKTEDSGATIQVNVKLPASVTAPTQAPRSPYGPEQPSPRDYHPRDYPPRDYPYSYNRDYPPRDYPPRDPYYPPIPNYGPSSPMDYHRDYPPRDPYYPPRHDYGPTPPRPDYVPPPSRPNFGPPPPTDYHRDYPPRDPYYPPRHDYGPPPPPSPPRNPYYERDPPSSAEPPTAPLQSNYKPRPDNRQNHQESGNKSYRGGGARGQGGVNRKYRKQKKDGRKANDGNDSDTSVASSKH